MTRAEFEEIQSSLQCWSCHRTGTIIVKPHPSDHTHPGGLRCGTCDVFQGKWLSKEKNADKRKSIPKDERDAIWDAWGNVCLNCGISKEDLAFIGVMRTVQHVPPYRETGDNGHLVPYCEWCQQRSESESKRIRSLISRLRELQGKAHAD